MYFSRFIFAKCPRYTHKKTHILWGQFDEIFLLKRVWNTTCTIHQHFLQTFWAKIPSIEAALTNGFRVWGLWSFPNTDGSIRRPSLAWVELSANLEQSELRSGSVYCRKLFCKKEYIVHTSWHRWWVSGLVTWLPFAASKYFRNRPCTLMPLSYIANCWSTDILCQGCILLSI